MIIKELEKVVRGEIKRLAIFLPPGSAKSTYASVLFPPWFLGQKPNSSILTCSHSGDLAESFGRRGRNLIDLFGSVLGYKLKEDSKAAGRWETSNGGLFFCAGVGAGIAGHRADLGLIDDPIGKKEDADSKLIRDKQWDWYNFDFKPRLKPDASIVLIQTRWHEEDLAGKILAAEGEQWKVLRIPFFAEDNDPLNRKVGELLWPEWFKKEMYPTDARVASALYQNRPTPEEGDFFKAAYIRTYSPDELPTNLRVYAASDHAVSMRQDADRTCFGCGGLDEDDNLYILPDIFWKQAPSDEVVQAMLDMSKRRHPISWRAEKGHISQSIGPFLYKRMMETRNYIAINEITAVRDKQTRAQSIRARMAMGKVFFPANASWWTEALHELLTFPAGKHDDFVDFIAHLGMEIDSMSSPDRVKMVKETLEMPKLTLGWLKSTERNRKHYSELELLDK